MLNENLIARHKHARHSVVYDLCTYVSALLQLKNITKMLVTNFTVHINVL